MAKAHRSFGTSCGLGPYASRRGLLQAGLAIGTLALGQRTALGQSGGVHVHMPELGVAKLPVVAAMEAPLVEPEVRRSVNGVLMKPGETLKIRLTNDFPPNRDLVPQDLSRPHQFNNTNFHFHGAHCSPSGIADNVMRAMVPRVWSEGSVISMSYALPGTIARMTLSAMPLGLQCAPWKWKFVLLN